MGKRQTRGVWGVMARVNLRLVIFGFVYGSAARSARRFWDTWSFKEVAQLGTVIFEVN